MKRFLLFLFLCNLTLSYAKIVYDKTAKKWTLSSGNVEYRLADTPEGVCIEYFGPAGETRTWKDLSNVKYEGTRFFDFNGMCNKMELGPANFDLKSFKVSNSTSEIDVLTLVLKHKKLALEVTLIYKTFGNTGVITREINLHNTGSDELFIEKFPSLNFKMPFSDYELQYMTGHWGEERQLVTETLSRTGSRNFTRDNGRSSDGFASWFSLFDKQNKIRYMAQLAYSGNWEMNFSCDNNVWVSPNTSLMVEMGMRFDFGKSLILKHGASFNLPTVAFTAGRADLDDVANQMHRYQRNFVVPKIKTNDPLLVQFNSWYPFPGKMYIDDMKKCADVAAEMGAEVFVLDAGWYNKVDWSKELGDYTPDPKAFPKGLEELSDYVHLKKMKFGLWVEIENVGTESEIFKSHPDWCLSYNGKPVEGGDRRHLDFSKKEVYDWAFKTIKRLVENYKLEWMKIDYNINVGEKFESNQQNTVLYNHLISYYSLLDSMRRAFPTLVIENCASGGMRFDLGIIGHTHTTWLSDNTWPKEEAQLAWGSTLEFIPEVCNHWMTGDTADNSVRLPADPDWCNYMFRIPMNGQYGISSLVQKWTPDITKSATANVKLYKRIRPILMGSDVYHLTPMPDHFNPTGWMGIEYVNPQSHKILLMAYRLKNGEQKHVFNLREINPAQLYVVYKDGVKAATVNGAQLRENGFTVELLKDFNAAVIEIEPQAK